MTSSNLTDAIDAIPADRSRLPAGLPRARLTKLRALALAAAASAEGRFVESSDLREKFSDAKAALAAYLGRCAEEGKQPDPRHAEHLHNRVAELEVAITAMRQRDSSSVSTDAAARRVTREAQKFANRQNGNARAVDTPLPKATIGDLLEKRGALVVTRQEIEQAPEPRAAVEQRLMRQIDELAESGAPRLNAGLDIDPRHPRGRASYSLSIRWPLEHLLGVESRRDGEVPAIVDTAKLVCWAARDAVKDSISREIQSFYAGIELALSVQEKRDRLRDINAEILGIERQIAALAWRGIENGDVASVARLDGLNPKAVLAIA